MTGWPADAALAVAVLAGSSVQRMTGMGFALVAAPVVVLLLGPGQGVVLVNCASGCISAIGLAETWRRVRLPAMGPLVAAAACTVPVGAWAVHRVPEPVMLAGMGAAVTGAVLLAIGGLRAAALRGTGGAMTAGAVSGFMNSAAGVGGPALSLYAVNAEWTVREFVPNAQFYSLVVNALSVAAHGLPRLPGTTWSVAAGGLAAGAVVGVVLDRRVPERWARVTMLGLALAGGVTTLAKGLWSL